MARLEPSSPFKSHPSCQGSTRHQPANARRRSVDSAVDALSVDLAKVTIKEKWKMEMEQHVEPSQPL